MIFYHENERFDTAEMIVLDAPADGVDAVFIAPDFRAVLAVSPMPGGAWAIRLVSGAGLRQLAASSNHPALWKALEFMEPTPKE
jgi:hypothetical protein